MSVIDRVNGARGVGLALAWLVAMAVSPTVMKGQTSERLIDARTIRVSGVGEVRAEPDLATVQFAVETTGATAQEAGQENAQMMERVIRALMAAGVAREDIQTSGYSLYPEYVQEPRPTGELQVPRIRGYRASNQVSVRTPNLEQVGRLIDIGLEAGANRMHGVSFELRNSEAAETLALERAIGDARSAAETIARSLGVTLGPILDASTNTEPVRPMYRVAGDMAVRESFAAAPTPIEPGEQTIHATASLIFQID